MPHIHEKIDFVVSAWIVCNRRVLLVFHKKQKMWLPIGGHIELDEDPEEALFREVKEECGLDIELMGKKPKFSYRDIKFFVAPKYMDIHMVNNSNNHRHIALEYFAKAKSDSAKLSDSEHDEIRWFTRKELNESKYKIHPAIQFLAEKALGVAK